jgi:NADP-dependent 3-hydroxy acid dehydrogenase YdfG
MPAAIEVKIAADPISKKFTSTLEQILDQEDEMEEDEFVLPLSNDKSKVEVKTVLITGATSGIGLATAELFARNGYRVIATGRRADRLAQMANHFKEKYHAHLLTLPFDVRDLEAVKSAIENLPEEWRDVDILINNAGLSRGLSPIHEGNIEHWETMIDTNIKGLLYLTRAVAPHMVERRSGHIINVASSAGKEVYPNGNVYCATKFAVDALTKAMRLDLYTHNIRVSQVAPGHVEETEFARVRFDWDVEKAAKVYENFQPLRSSDVAEVIYFIATRPAHVNVQDVLLFATQQAGSNFIDRSGRA